MKHSKPKHAFHTPRRTLSLRYGMALRKHPIQTILVSTCVLTAILGSGLGAYYVLVYQKQVHGWQDAPAAPIGRVTPLPGWQNERRDIYGSSTVKVVSDATKGKAIQFLGAANASEPFGGIPSQRAELTPKTGAIKPGQTVWIGLDLWVGKSLGIAQDFQQIMQVRDNTEGSPSLVLAVNERTEELSLRRSDGPEGTPDYTKSLGATVYDGWTRLVIGLQVSRSGDSSTVEAWRDNAPKMLRENWPAYNQAGDSHAGGLLYDNASSAYVKFGLYRAPQAWPMDIRMANIKIAGSKDAVQ